MKILQATIKNYKNLDGVSLKLNPFINFLVGENDMGKSNSLALLDTVLNHKIFTEDDFFDAGKPIEVEFLLYLDEAEIGLFEDLFSPEDNHTINVVAKQESPDDYIKYFHKESGEEISSAKIRCANYIKYDSLRMPKDELTFYRNKGVGKFLGYLIERIFNAETSEKKIEYLNVAAITPIITDINKKLEKIKVFRENNISAQSEDNIKELIYKIVSMKDSKGFDIHKIGYGIQFSALIILSILEKLMLITRDKKYAGCIFEHEGKKCVSLILGMDEPEIHLHPYKQRSLAKYIHQLLNNDDKDFSLLIKELFGIDHICGQAIIVTHSPNIVLNEYKQIIRFYSEDSKINVVSGSELKLNEQLEKHLLMNFPYVKEAMFSKCTIVGEGPTELGALPEWVLKELGAIDEFGITVVGANGGTGIKAIMELLGKFKISNVGIIDRDIYSEGEVNENLLITDSRDFEQDLVETLFAANQENMLFELVGEYEKIGLDFHIQEKALVTTAEKYGISISWENKGYKLREIKDDPNKDLRKAMLLAWLRIRKTIVLGRFIAKKIPKEHIPKQYSALIQKAKSLAK